MTKTNSWKKWACLAFSLLLGLNTSAQLSETELADKIAAKEQITNVPTIYITIPDVGSSDNELDSQLFKDQSTYEAAYHSAIIQVIDADHPDLEFTDYVSIKVRGNSTSTQSKRPYRLKFEKSLTDPNDPTQTVSSSKHDLLGYGYKERSWVLLANAFDHSLIRNALTYHIGKYVGMPFCAGYRFVDLVINGNYRGCYQVSDHVNVSENRVNINEDTDQLLEHVSSITKFRDDFYVSNDNGLGYTNIKNPDREDLTEEQADALTTELQNYLDNWYNATNAKTYNDMETLTKFYLGLQLTGDYDGCLVAKTYRINNGVIHWGPLWDKDLAYGNGPNMENKFSDDTWNGQICSFFNKLHTDFTFLTAINKLMSDINIDGLYASLETKIDELKDYLADTWKQNYQKWGDKTDQSSWADTQNSLGSHAAYIANLKEWLPARISFVKEKIQGWYNDLLNSIESVDYNPNNDWWGTGLTQNKLTNATVKNRSLTANQWNTFCLPYDVDQAVLEQTMGCTFELLVHTGMAADGETMIFAAPESKDIQAGYPYLIKPAQNVGEYTLPQVTYMLNVNNGTNAYNGELVSFDNKHYFGASLFHGYEIVTSTDYLFADDVYTDDNSLAMATANNQNGCRAYIRVTDGAAPKIQISEGSVEPAVRTQLTDVPTIYIDTENGAEVQSSTGDYVAAIIQVIDENGTLKPFAETNYQDLEIRGKGVTEWNNHDKKSYRLKFVKKKKSSDGQEHKHDLTGAGFPKRNWVLLGSAEDKSLLRHALTYTVGSKLDMAFTPHYCFVDLVLNGDYLGTYIATDFIEIDLNRVIAEDEDEDNDWLLELTNTASSDPEDLALEGDNNTPYVIIKNPEASKTVTAEQIQSNVQSFFSLFWNDNSGTYYDVASLAKWYVAVEVMGGYYALSDVYAYKSPDSQKLSFGPLWNGETAYNNVASQNMLSLMDDLENDESFDGMVFNSGETSPLKTKLAALWQRSWFKTAVKAEWDEVKGSIQTTLTNQLSALAQAVALSQAKNYDLTGDDYTLSSTDYEAEVSKISAYITARIPYLTRKFALLTAETILRGDADGNGEVDIADAVAVLRHTVGNTPSVFNETNADANGDGEVDVVDAVVILRMSVSQ